MSCRHWIYYHCVSARTSKKEDKGLTLNHYVLTSLFVLLTSAANLVSKAIALVSEDLTMLAHWDPLLQLTLDMKDQKLAASEEEKTHFHEDFPSSMHGQSHCPHPLVKGMLHIIQLLHLGYDLSRRGKFFIRGPELRFTVTWGLRSRKCWGSHHGHLLSNPTSSDPSLHFLEGLCEVSDIGRELQWRVSLFPMEGIPLGWQRSAPNSAITTSTNSHGTTPQSHANSWQQQVSWAHG